MAFRQCVFSDVKGRVVLNGQPVANAVIERRYSDSGFGIEYSDSTKTDNQGYFSFGAIWKLMFGAMFPGEINIYQEIWITHEGKKYEAWRLTKHRPLVLDGELPAEGLGETFDPKTFDRFADYPKRKIVLLCDLAHEPSWKEPWLGGTETLFGVCQVVKDI